jgi:hypothetical protein
VNLRSALSYLELGAWLDSLKGADSVTSVATSVDVFKLALRHVSGERPVYLEFGVFEGRSMRWWSEHLTNPNARLIGFDSFTGLPEDWRPGLEKGSFATGGPPSFDDPRVSFVQGWFEESLAGLALPAHDQLIVNIDCDLYTSTDTVLRWLEPHAGPGTLLYFDEFSDRDHEMRAFFESLARSARAVEPLAIGAGGLHWLFRLK